MKTAELRELASEELHQQISELKEELFNLRFQLATGQLDNHRRIRQVKREVSRIRTVLRERDFAYVQAGTPAAEPVATPVTEPAEPEPVAEEGSE